MVYWRLAEEEAQRRRLAERDKPPPMPSFGKTDPNQPPPMPELGPLAVPTGTAEKPPEMPIYGPNDPRSRNFATAKTIPPGPQRVADVLSPPGTPSRKVFGLLGALSTADPERDIAAELQQASPFSKFLMAQPIGAPVGSLAGTAGRGVARQLGAGVGRAIETGGAAAGIPRAAETVAARAAKLTPAIEARLRAIPADKRAAQIASIEKGPLSAEQKAARIKILQEPPITPSVTQAPSLSAAGQGLPSPRPAAPEAPVGAEAVSESVGQIAKESRAAPTGAPPTKPPVPPTATGAVSPAGPTVPPYVEPPMMGKNVLGMKPIQAGLSKTEEIANIARRTVGKVGIKTVEANPLVSGAFKERGRLKAVVESQAGVLSSTNGPRLARVFKMDKTGRIADLAGIDPAVPGAPTIQDVAARLPRYWDRLSAEQKAAVEAVRNDTTPFRSLLDEVGVEVPSRADVIEGGFYLPRGRADIEGADLPMKIGTGLSRGGKKSFEKPAVFDSQAAGIEAGYTYSPITDTLAAYARDAGNRAVDAHVTNFFKTATNETGLPLGNTPKMRLLEQDPAIAQKHEALQKNLERLKRLSASLTNRQLEVIDKWSLDPTFDDLDVLLDGLKTMRAGRGQGMIASEVNAALVATRQAIRALAPEYKVALRRAQQTPRLEGSIGLSGLQGWAFPDEIANAANIILRGEGPPTGLASMPIRIANAFNNLYRGMRATLDNSAIGIQGLLGAADDPVAYGKALGVNLRAWGPGGDAALGRYIEQFDEASRAAGRLGASDWARGGLRTGGVQTEFNLGAGISEKLTRAPGIRQANRAFGYFGDALRLDWADDMLAAELRKGRSVQELWDAGDVERIAEIANNMTGWARGKAFGSMGDLLLFAPRFLQSRAETVVKGVAGLRPGASIEQRAARRSLLKMMGYGAVITVAANQMLGNETDFRPIIYNQRRKRYEYNSNFMRIRFAGRDWSIYGTWDSFARAIAVTAMGRPQEAMRGLGSGVVSDAWDIVGDRDFEGNKVRDTPLHFGAWLLRSMLPFSTQEVPATVKGGVEAVRSGDIGKAAGAALTVGGEVIGAKSSPMTTLERLHASSPGTIRENEQAYASYFAIATSGLKDYPARQAAEQARTAYRTAHPDVDAKLFIIGETTAFQTTMGRDAAVRLMKENGIGIEDIKSLEVKPDESPTVTKRRADLERRLGIVPQAVPTPSSATPTVSTPDISQELRDARRRYGIPESTPVGATP